MRPQLSALLLALWTATGATAACAPFSPDPQCSLSGECDPSLHYCKCNSGWIGDDCSTLWTDPLDASFGFDELFAIDHNISSSWGGLPLSGDDGLNHLFFTQILNHCPLLNESTNAACAHAVSPNPLGPFNLSDVLMEPECRDVAPMRGPAGEWLVWHVSSGGRKPVDCAVGTTDTIPVDDEEPRLSAPGGDSGIGVLVSTSPYGPWTRVTNLIFNGNDGEWDSAGVTNPAPLLLANGSVMLAYTGTNATGARRLGLAMADSWRGPYTKLTRAGPITSVDSTEPFLWVDGAGNLHILFDSNSTDGGASHCFARAGQPTNWTTSPIPVFTRDILWANNTRATVPRRGRPQLRLSASGTPLSLYTGVVVASDAGVFGPAFTSAQNMVCCGGGGVGLSP